MANNVPTGIQNMADRFRTPQHAEYGPVPIWWWSGDKVTRDRLRWQMEQLLSQGVAQAVIMNLAPSGPLYGALADDPPFMSEEWWELFLGVGEDARELGFRFWPYDQIGFSGANFQGRLVTQHPSWAGQKLGRAEQVLDSDDPFTLTIPQNAHALSAYAVNADGDSAVAVPLNGDTASWSGNGDRLVVVYAQEHGFDYFNAAAVAALMDTVHGEFKRRASHLFGNVIVGFFQDELPSMPTWGTDLADRFRAEYGHDVTASLAALWGDPLPADAAIDPDVVRISYERLRTRLSREGFFDQLNGWFAENGLQCGFDQQSPAREGDPVGSVAVYGDYVQTHSGFSAPGSDHLGDPKVHSSMAHLSGGTRTWIEAFHSSGWGGTLEETYDWLAPFLKRGATLYDPHAVYYSTPGGWWEWAPPSTCWRQPYWPEYHILSGAVTRLSEALSHGTLVADTALIFPTTTVQAGYTFTGPTNAAAAATRTYHSLNGETAWSSERRGILDEAAYEYEIVNDVLLADARVDEAGLHIGPAVFRNVILPAMTVIDDEAAQTLARFVDAGGTLVAVETVPDAFLGTGPGAEAFSTAVDAGHVIAVATAGEVVDKLRRTTPWVQTDVPSLLREVAGGYLLALFAHDASTGTEQPIYKGDEGYLDWIEVGWASFWEGLRETGYNFRPIGERTSQVTLHGTQARHVQRWNPTTGERSDVAVTVHDDGTLTIDVDFRDGSVTLLAIGDQLPPADRAVPRQARTGSSIAVTDWTVEPTSTLDNRWGDFASRDREGVLPIEVWSFETAVGESLDNDTIWRPAVATFGPFGEVAGPVSSETIPEYAWMEAEWSLSRGIRDDVMHRDNLGPKGYVPEEFLSWKDVEAGDVVAARTWIDVPDDNHTLVVGVNARAEIRIDDIRHPAAEDAGYWSSVPVTSGRHRVEFRFTAMEREPVRANFAVVGDLAAYQRAEWVVPTDLPVTASVVSVTRTFDLDAQPKDGRIQVGAEQPCTIFINGTEVGRQNAFHPYGGHREARFHPYDLAPHLQIGTNILELRSVDSDRQVAVVVDSVPAAFGGLDLLTGQGAWTATRDSVPTLLARRSRQWGDPRLLSLVPRPHPLPQAGWLEKPPYPDGVVANVIPDLNPTASDPRWLRCTLPIGTTSIEVPADQTFTAFLNGVPVIASDGRIELAAPAEFQTVLTLRFDAQDGRRGGALLSNPLRASTAATSAPLEDWTELGLGALAGEVCYRATLPDVSLGEGERVQLDLGQVRGSVEVLIDGATAGQLAWGPYVVDITDQIGSNSVVEVRVHNTLAGYLDVASPTPGVFPGQKRAGLFGPVNLVVTQDTVG
ncbi:hypothetical protein [Leifsonia sp. Leaf264]|uniref:hypothetical protein n=1 Tax=Leifsonia sp. Leaf264 TaxID=1736314 RepID=UPI0006F2D3B7|nr:hypothetical protein [Leifsonia sp. Leaf264]KQO97484.1 hypothetical protein ASF30_13700 [Leifsonia sp. Leaf264]